MKTDEKLDKIVEKLEQIDSRIDCIDVTLVKQAGQLEHHIYRTDLSEKHILLLEKKVEPIEKHVSQVSGAFKFIGGIAVVVGIFKAAIEAYSFFF